MSQEVTFYIDDKPVKARLGDKILWAALDNGIYIPNLCAIREQELPFGACRLCFVEIEGRSLPVTACTEPVTEGMHVSTRSELVDQLRRTALELLLSHHDTDCKRCFRNGSCGLQHLSKTLKVPLKPKRLRQLPIEMPIDNSHDRIVLNPNRCVLCGKCIWVCNEQEKIGAIDFVFRGLSTRVAPFGLEPLAESACTGCERCADICPTGALIRKEPASSEKGQAPEVPS